LEEGLEVAPRRVRRLGRRDLVGRRVVLARLLARELGLERGEEVRLSQRPGSAIVGHRDDDEEIEPRPDERCEIARRGLVGAEGGEDRAQPAQPPRGATALVRPRELDLVRVADEDVHDLARAVDEDPDAPPELVRERRELADEVRGGRALLRDAPAVEPLQRLQMARLETADSTEDALRQSSVPPRLD